MRLLRAGASAPAPGTAAQPTERWLWVDGRLCRGESAVISLFDRGARDGEGLFETLRVYAGRPFLWERHLERLVVSAAELGFPVPPSPAVLERAVAEVLNASRLAEAVVRITVTRGIPGQRPSRSGGWVEVEPLAGRLWAGPRRGRAAAVISCRPFEAGPLGRHKTTSRLAYHLAREEARARGADEALLVSSRGEVLEGATSSLFAVVGGRIVTPPLAAGILPGITRAWTLRAARELGLAVNEEPLARERLTGAEEVFLTNAIQQVVPLAVLEERPLPEPAIGLRLLEAYRAAVRQVAG